MVVKLILKLFRIKIKKIKCFTTRPDTLFGFSFLALSIDHPISDLYKNDSEFKSFKRECSKSGTTEESIANAEKIGFKQNYLLKIHLKMMKWSLFILLILS